MTLCLRAFSVLLVGLTVNKRPSLLRDEEVVYKYYRDGRRHDPLTIGSNQKLQKILISMIFFNGSKSGRNYS